ncbi:hypothetical protein AX16_001961 [Volvariella volvacea WC 439]|nr:hypothetical protein AX16_001961 [Volvariella volvacea WC 439]
MVDLGWANIGYFDNPEDALVFQHAIARYHAFLDLMWSSPASFFVPTLDIDLAWHTHQLMSPKYESDCMEHVGRFTDQWKKLSSLLPLTSPFEHGKIGLAFVMLTVDVPCQERP